MLNWVLKTLLHERLSALATAGGVALAMLLVLYLDAVFRGEADQVVAFIENTPGELWVLQSGIENLHMTRSRLAEQSIADVRWAADAARAEVLPLVYRDALVGPEGAHRIAYVVGVSPHTPVTAWDMADGNAVPQPGQAIVPAAMAAQLNLGLGDDIRVGDQRLQICGLSRGTFSMANPLLFIHEQDARDILDVADGANLLIVHGADRPEKLAAAMRDSNDDIQVLTREALIASDRRIALEMGGELIYLMGLIGLVVSALVVSFSTFAFVSLRQRELAIMRATGATTPALIGTVLVMSLTLALAGVCLAGLLVPVSSSLLLRFVPEVAVHFSVLEFVRLSLAIVMVAMLAAIIPALRVVRVDPTLVFQS